MAKSNREIGNQYERDVAKQLGLKRVPGSGSSKELKEDLFGEGIKVQCKFTSAKSISIKSKDLRNLQENALNCGKIPILIFYVNGEEWIAGPSWWTRTTDWWKDLVFGAES